MKNFFLLSVSIITIIISSSLFSVFAQNEPILYFCEKYDSRDGEVGVSDRFTTGHLTVMAKCDNKLNLTDVTIQFDKYNFRNGKFEFYKNFNYSIDPDMKYVYFSKNDDSDMSFDDAGFYRVFLLDERDRTVASAVIEIIP
jgi:hypothetical protein